ncbi:hypothetical protein EHQ16_03285 [Leptospira kanakyensis]|uniref:Uncharacterized protein n=1 Tax=Leptospira kanakyensis TaxID=2484968 RepID=A0A6N4Q7Y5_9LEPT|nr:hypothetical protein [Leptospira kanakyensis]TGK47506.1 hypothetical protein EHQ11_16345 [Leptospira kanakyensis]TGK63491.1 hypothetical protein EHQ16_03285 [Leptospira kanakyensis]TGK67095.1 hypothetical protein EHQ18_18525 [Leptospira kanakyensis]
MSIADDLVTIFLANFSFHWPSIATVRNIKKEPNPSTGDSGLLTAIINNASKDDIQFFPPFVPKTGSKCLVISLENRSDRSIAIGFNQIEKIKGQIGSILKYELSESGLKINLTPLEVKIEPTGVTIGSGTITAPNTILLKTYLTQLDASLQSLYTAIKVALITPSDGGSSLKGSLVAAIESIPLPAVPAELDKTNLKYSVGG